MDQGKCELCPFQVDGLMPGLVAWRLAEHVRSVHVGHVMEVTASIEPGDHDLFCATATVGGVKVIVYQSTVRPGGVTIEIDTWFNMADKVSVCLNDQEIYRAAD